MARWKNQLIDDGTCIASGAAMYSGPQVDQLEQGKGQGLR